MSKLPADSASARDSPAPPTVSTGIPGLDEVLRGGLPSGYMSPTLQRLEAQARVPEPRSSRREPREIDRLLSVGIDGPHASRFGGL
jgi:hypothetical protein